MPNKDLSNNNLSNNNLSNKIPVAVSARHCHLSKKDFEAIFGEGVPLTKRADLSQPGQFASNETVTIIAPKNELVVRILGPFRNDTQIEVSATEARGLGLQPPIRESGHIEKSPGVIMRGPKGEITLSQGVIVAKRHIHATTDDAKNLNVKDQEIVMVKVQSGERNLIFDDVVVRVSDSYALELHIDTDEGNAAGLAGATQGEVIKHN